MGSGTARLSVQAPRPSINGTDRSIGADGPVGCVPSPVPAHYRTVPGEYLFIVVRVRTIPDESACITESGEISDGGRHEPEQMTRYTARARAALLGGLAHVVSMLAVIASYVTVSGHAFAVDSFVDGGVPIAALFVLGAACSLSYRHYALVSPAVLIGVFDIVAVVSSPPEVWTEPAPAGPPSIYGFYVHLFVLPLGIAVLAGAVEYFVRRRRRAERTRSSV